MMEKLSDRSYMIKITIPIVFHSDDFLVGDIDNFTIICRCSTINPNYFNMRERSRYKLVNKISGKFGIKANSISFVNIISNIDGIFLCVPTKAVVCPGLMVERRIRLKYLLNEKA